ncbi:MAG: aminotransferase class I/II-fold pyridoxal phosphate-dependent enzyme [Methanomicrobiaceae archaeon]|nr:aminotransferase class I/II-fold pyridoxal phosphate-dependent enzyme [Methanomicrobiaceae archaeon]
MKINIEPRIDTITMPENVRIGLLLRDQRKTCALQGCHEEFFGFAFGQSPFPVPKPISDALAANATRAHYVDAAGIRETREAIAGFYRRHFGIETDADRVIVGNGSKELMFLIFSMISGSLILPSPSWIGYAPQLRFLGKPYHLLSTRPENGYKIDPADLEALLEEIVAGQHILLLNNPHNPTGALYSRGELERIAEVCRRTGTLVLADEIYALTTYDIGTFVSMGTIYPEGTFVTGGLSKDRSAAGYRFGTCILPSECSEKMVSDFTKLAATLYTNITTPVQCAAITAYSPDPIIERYFEVTRDIHRMMGEYFAQAFSSIEGITTTIPQGAFYFLMDMNALKPELQRKGVVSSNELENALIAHPHHVATVTGDAIMMPQDHFSARIAFVDYDGGQALELYENSRPVTGQERAQFVERAAPRMVDGVEAVRKFVKNL